ncbi:cyclic lactone autoinducer peptide [Anaeromicropila populeti]|uniref:Cyclic lactone autoinducer peptide n=1 Tax=Anaeromicropila populeti TaxID=37658 RepID=A0A1I6JCG2_9FIRM|nr:cyclic lactone autoinducer peptide [Anaeromicropila populeti]SFR76604.1 cyclic lactone autoinducer peptide [Anaeromicropila populeti]
MKKGTHVLQKAIGTFSESVVKGNVNSACIWWLHQPKLPRGCEKFKK